MADLCAYCGSTLSPGEQFCPGCGAPNPGYAPAAAPPEFSGTPRTIEELRAFCASKGMPLEKMRFFIGVNEPSPRAFGIYREGGDFVVYKNKSDGSRAIRYRGPDEAHAVGEIYRKLLEEHQKRAGGGKPASTGTTYYGPGGASGGSPTRGGRKTTGKPLGKFLPIVLILLGYLVFSVIPGRISHRNDGYYRVGDDLFYRYGTSWFMDSYSGYGDDGWTEIDDFPYDNENTYYQGSTYDEDWGSSDFQDSWIWDEYQSSSDSDSDWDSDWDDYDYDDWDSGDTDWDSDW